MTYTTPPPAEQTLSRHLLGLFAGKLPPAAFALVAGAGAYAAWPVEPAFKTAAITAAVLLFTWAVLALWGRFIWPLRCAGLAGLMALGFAWAAYHSQYLTPGLWPAAKDGQLHWVTGHVDDITTTARSKKLLLGTAQVYTPGEPPQTLHRMRISVPKSRAAGVLPGGNVALQAQLFSPSGPSFAGGFNARRYDWFNRISAVGMVWGGFYETAGAPAAPLNRISALRQRMAAWLAANNRPSGGLAATLVTGIRDRLPQTTMQAYRNSGLAHVTVVAGLHLAIMAGWIYLLLCHGLALWPRLANRHDVRKPAAVATLAAAGAYTLMAGAGIPTIRAFVLIAALMCAILTGRLRLGIRALALAAVLIVAADPLAVAGPSFQMSFTATLALMLWASARAWDTARLKGLGRMGHLRTLAENALIAGLATLPIAAFHFGQVALAGVLANVLAVPVLGFFVLPAALLTVTLMPFGPAGEAMRQVLWAGCWVLNHIAVWVAGLPYTVAYVPVWMGLLFMPACLLLIFLVITHRWRGAVLGLVALGASVHWLPRLNTPADLVWFPRQQVLLVRGAGGYAMPQDLGADTYTAKRLVQAFNRNHPLTGDEPLATSCDGLGCIYGGGTPQSRVLVPTTTASGEDCAQNALILGDAGPCEKALWPDETRAVYIWLGPHVTYRAWQPDGGRIWSE